MSHDKALAPVLRCYIVMDIIGLLVYIYFAQTTELPKRGIVKTALLVAIVPLIITTFMTVVVALLSSQPVSIDISMHRLLVVALQFVAALGVFRVLEHYQETLAQWFIASCAGALLLYACIPPLASVILR